MSSRQPRYLSSAPRRALRLLSATLLLVGLAGCAANKPYHACLAEPCASDARPVQAAADHTLAFVEFDDQGWLHEERQLAAVRASIETAAAPGGDGVIVVGFVHGWHHDARPGDGNVEFFRSALSQLARVERGDAELSGRAARRVLGVYFGWRGRVYPKGVNFVTFWNRKATAHRIGERALTDAVLSLRDAVPQPPAGGRAAGRAPDRFVLIGHSFGGAALFSATSQLVLERLETPAADALPTARAQRPVGLADLVVLINPAFEAARLEPLLRAANRKGSRAVQLGVFTSESDWATGITFPLGRLPSMVYLSHRSDAESPFPGAPTVSQFASNRSALGHYREFVTHRLRRIDATGGDPLCRNGVAPMRQPEESPLVQDALPPVPAAPKTTATATAAATPAAGATPTAAEPTTATNPARYGDASRGRQLATDSQAQQQVLRQKTAEGSLTLPLPLIGLCLESTQPKNRQYGVFNVRVDADLLDGHGIAQGEQREKAFMAFLAEFIRYGAAQNDDAQDTAAEANEGF